MIKLRTSSEAEQDGFFEMMRCQLLDQEQAALTGLGLTWESLARKFKSDGEVRAVLSDGEVAGFVWIELRPPTLYVQSMILSPAFRGQGIGTPVFRVLEQEFHEVADEIVIGTLKGNEGAIDFYRHAGFVPVEEESPSGFENFRKKISPHPT